MGNLYERLVGLVYEKKSKLVIYHGFIKGYKDKGIDIIALSTSSILLIQCKNWQKKTIMLEDIQNIFNKLSCYRPDFEKIDPKEINTYLKSKKSQKEIKSILHKKYKTTQKILYLSNVEVLDKKALKHIKYLKKNTYQYKDMKIMILAIMG